MHRRTSSQRHLSQSGMPRPSGPSHFLPLSSLGGTTGTDSSILVNIAELLHPRKSRQRTTVLCLVTLIIITTYICFVSPPLFSPSGLHRPKLAHAEDTWRKLAAKLPSHPPGFLPPHPPPEISLSPEQELGALTAFMAALPQNVIPSDIDPMRPIDPQLVLDFNTRGPKAKEEVTDIVAEVWIRNPVVLFSKLPSAISRELKSMLQDMNLKPAPTIFDINQRDDADVLIPLLFRLTNSTELPILLIGGKPIGSMDLIRELNADGRLHALALLAGAGFDNSKKRRKGHR